MSCFACLLAILAALVFGSPELNRTLRLDLGMRGACLTLSEAGEPSCQGLTLGLATFSLDAEAGLRVDLRV